VPFSSDPLHLNESGSFEFRVGQAGRQPAIAARLALGGLEQAVGGFEKALVMRVRAQATMRPQDACGSPRTAVVLETLSAFSKKQAKLALNIHHRILVGQIEVSKQISKNPDHKFLYMNTQTNGLEQIAIIRT
jgi:hypothetical protein